MDRIDYNAIINTENSHGTRVEAKDLPKDTIDLFTKEKVLAEKKSSRHQIIEDLFICCFFFAALIFGFIHGDFKVSNLIDIALVVIALAIIITLVGRLLITIPKRIHNYRTFNFERTCYATVKNKYVLTKKVKRRRVPNYFADVQLNKDNYVHGVKIDNDKYCRLEQGDKVILTSFDGYYIHLVTLNP